MGLFTTPPNLMDLAGRAVKALERIATALEDRRPAPESGSPADGVRWGGEPEPDDAVPLAR